MNMHQYESPHGSSVIVRLAALLGLFLAGLLLSVPLLAQTGQGTVTGTVADLSQAIIPHAHVTLTNIATGVTTKGQSSEVGIYYFGAVPIGSYKITVEKEGFQQWEGTFTLDVGQNAVVNPTLKVGTTTTVVEVNSVAAPIETQSGAVGDIKESSQIRDLPLNGRAVSSLFDLTAGVESSGTRVNGMKVGSLDINMDGATMVNRFGGGITSVQPSVESIQEFRIETVGSDARFDQPATVIMATRSGSNQLHGAGYEYLRDNSVVGAARLRTDPVGSGFQLPLLIRNEFGGWLSGPVDIPHVYNGKDKAFWFFDWEGLRTKQRATPLINDVPTAAMWQGDLSNAIDAGTNLPITIYDPTTTDPTTFQRTPFLNNAITSPISHIATTLQSLTAPPTNSANPFLEPNFTATYPQVTTTNRLTAKWDENLTDKDRLSVRFTRYTTNAETEGGYFADPISPQTGMGTSVSNNQTTNIAVNYNRTISPNWLNELLVGVLREPNHQGTVADFVPWDSKLGTPNPFNVTGWPTLYVQDLSPNIYLDWDSDNNKQQHMTSETIEDNVTWTHSKHTVQFGFRGRKEQNNIEELQQAQGFLQFGPAAYTSLFDAPDLTAYPDTGDGFADLLLGLPNQLANQYNRGFFYFRQTEIGLYASDKIKLTPRLTLNLGLRWDYFTPYSEARNRMSLPYDPEHSFAVLTPGNASANSLGVPPSALAAWSAVGLTWATADSAGYPSNLFNTIHHDWGPRLGVAYQLRHNTVIRGSYGIYYVPEPLNLLLQSMRRNPPINLNYQNLRFLNPTSPAGQVDHISASIRTWWCRHPQIICPAPP